MVSSGSHIVSLSDISNAEVSLVGGKAKNLSTLIKRGFNVPKGLCLTIDAYKKFVKASDLNMVIKMEIGRKPLEKQRWEEIWDTSLRIRSAFLATPIPVELKQQILVALKTFDLSKGIAIRSSSNTEDTANISFAGLHDSYINIYSEQEALKSIKLVWASLWSDAALLYKKELDLNPEESAMAVVIQEMKHEECSGVAFGIDPNDVSLDYAIIEAVPGLCKDLVDGAISPEQWKIDRKTQAVLDWKPTEGSDKMLLEMDDILEIFHALSDIEGIFNCYPDIEWTGRKEHFTILQARPITTVSKTKEPYTKEWYLSLRLKSNKLIALADKVENTLVPELIQEGNRLSGEPIEQYSNTVLSKAILERYKLLQKWKKIYWDDFIPFAHGIRQLGRYYNDIVKPKDPYEFVGLLINQEMIAHQRNSSMLALAEHLNNHPDLKKEIATFVKKAVGSILSPENSSKLTEIDGGTKFLSLLNDLIVKYMDISYDHTRFIDQPDILVKNILELSHIKKNLPQKGFRDPAILKNKLLSAIPEEKHQEAEEIIRIGMLSWKLRDDDNLLVGRLESQLIKALNIATSRLTNVTKERKLEEGDALIIANLLVSTETKHVIFEARMKDHKGLAEGTKVRQLVGQPASPGVATGLVRKVETMEDVSSFKAGEVIVCDAIQPQMTHLVPLAAAIIERRGGMLIHGAIIARELGIPCVNGVSDIMSFLQNGDVVTVDGYLGIVAVGQAELDFEFSK